MFVEEIVSMTLGAGKRVLLPPPLAALLVAAETAVVVCTVAKEIHGMLNDTNGGD